MKKVVIIVVVACLYQQAAAQQKVAQKVDRGFNKADQAVTKARTTIDIFQPYLLKARQLFMSATQMAQDVKQDAKNLKGNANSGSSDYTSSTGVQSESVEGNDYGYNNTSTGNNDYDNTSSQSNSNSESYDYGNYNGYTQQQYLPITNDATINQDGTGNMGNQNHGIYGNCLDVLTGNIVGMGEAEDNPLSIDLMFFASTDVQGNYLFMTPNFVKTNGTATYMTQHHSDGVLKWSSISESEVGLTNLTLAQFDKIQNNSQIKSVAKNCNSYAGYYSSVGKKMEGQVFSVRVEQEEKTVYALIAVTKHFGTNGSTGYLKIKVKSVGVDNNHDGQIDTQTYLRN